MSDGGWYYLENDQQKGPLRRDELLGEVGRRLPRSVPVWREGMTGWLPANEVSELAALLSRPAIRPDDDPRSLNPFTLLRRSFRWSGRFSRMEFFLGTFLVALVGGLMMTPAFVLDAFLGEDATASVLIGASVALATLVFVIGSYGGLTVRRLHDLGQSG